MIGMDLGSRNVKIVQMDNRNISDQHIFDTIEFYRRFGNPGQGSLKIDLAELGFNRKDRMVATGYGRITVQVDGAVRLPEIQAHVRGAVYQTGLDDFTLVDIGGQDTKIIKVKGSRVVDFKTNDRCAASSGRYLENMAQVLGLSLEELSRYSQEPVELNSTCAIFGETEIIAKIVEGCSVSNLAAGINYSLYRRFANMLDRLSGDTILLSGGVARNAAIREIVARETGQKVISLPQPQLNGAIGACLYGYDVFVD